MMKLENKGGMLRKYQMNVEKKIPFQCGTDALCGSRIVVSADRGRTENVRISDKKENTGRKRPPGSNAFVPSAAGLIIAGELVKDLTIW